MRFLLSPDSYKDCMTARRVCEVMADAIRAVMADAEIDILPLADGGEGTLQAVVDATGAELRTVKALDPLGRPVQSCYAVLPDGTVFIEMAQASGLERLSATERNPLVASTYGTGQMIADARRNGARRFIVSIGGSATVDGGAGMLQALGARLTDENGCELEYGGAALRRLHAIDDSALRQMIDGTDFTVACDVTSPLCGPLGAAAVFGPQKGADAAGVVLLEESLRHFASVAGDDGNVPGDGAAGGMGYALRRFMGAHMRSGASLVADLAGFHERLELADIVFTGEGRSDGQTLSGKLPAFVARSARACGKPCVLVSGAVASGSTAALREIFDAVFSTVQDVRPLSDILASAPQALEDCVKSVVSMLSLNKTGR